LLMKVKPDGDTVWTKTFGDFGDDRLYSGIVPTRDGNYLLGGNMSPSSPKETNLWILQFDSNGSCLWNTNYDQSLQQSIMTDCFISKIIPDQSGNFMMAGEVRNTDTSFGTDAFIMKIQPDRQVTWNMVIHYPGFDTLKTLRVCSDGEYLLGSDIYTDDADSTRIEIKKVRPDGTTHFTKRFYGTGQNTLDFLYPTADGNCLLGAILGGRQKLLNINSNGIPLWTKDFRDFIAFETIVPSSDGNFYLGANADETFSILKIKPDGTTLWMIDYKGIAPTAFSTIATIGAGIYLYAGKSSIDEAMYSFLACLIDDRYALKDSLLTFKIPFLGADSLTYSFSPLGAPEGMAVSPGGTISWTPTTDSAFLQHVQYAVVDGRGNADTLTFNIYVNSPTSQNGAFRPSQAKRGCAEPFDIVMSPSTGLVRFLLPSAFAPLCVYDISGRRMDRPAPVTMEGRVAAVWPAGNRTPPAGRYFARMTNNGTSLVKSFLYVARKER
jgi:hypothetical protein